MTVLFRKTNWFGCGFFYQGDRLIAKHLTVRGIAFHDDCSTLTEEIKSGRVVAELNVLDGRARRADKVYARKTALPQTLSRPRCGY